MNKVIIISPYSGKTVEEILRNTNYTQFCMFDCFRRGESPIAFHLIYPQVLDDNNYEERKKGMQAAYEWYNYCDYFVIYEDYGISPGMAEDIDKIRFTGKDKIYRKLYA